MAAQSHVVSHSVFGMLLHIQAALQEEKQDTEKKDRVEEKEGGERTGQGGWWGSEFCSKLADGQIVDLGCQGGKF